MSGSAVLEPGMAEELSRAAGVEVNEHPRKTLGQNRPTDLFDSEVEAGESARPTCRAAATAIS